MAITHACIATAGVSLRLSTADPLPLALAVLGSQLPDLDTTTSLIGQVCYPVSRWWVVLQSWLRLARNDLGYDAA